MTDIRAEPPRDRKKEKNIKHTGNIPIDQIYDVSSLASSRLITQTDGNAR